MHRPSHTELVEASLKEAMIVGWYAVLRDDNRTRLLFTWSQPEISQLLSFLWSKYEDARHNRPNQITKDMLSIETFVARLVYHQPYFCYKAIRFFQNYSVYSLNGYTLQKRLRVLNILQMCHRFPMSIVDPYTPTITNIAYKVMWLNIQPALNRYFTIYMFSQYFNRISEQSTQAVKYLRNYLHEIRQYAHNQETVYFVRIRDCPYYPYSVVVRYLRIYPFLVVVSPDDELPSDIQEHIELWVDRGVEFNSIVGNYICTERFGEFYWIRGPLCYAVEKGCPLIMHNFQQATNELIVALKTTMQNGYLYIQNLNRVIHCSPGFKILGMASQQIPNCELPHLTHPRQKVELLLPSTLPPLTYNYFHDLFSRHHEQLGNRRLRKLWNRVEYRRRQLLEEYYHCVIDDNWRGHLTELFKYIVMDELEEVLNVYHPHGVQLYQHIIGRKLKLGRVNIQLPQQPLLQKNIVHTQYSLRIVEKILMCSIMNESTLLISETGCGKTTLVQYAAELLKKKLHVFNMSLGSDVSDLVGGFKPVDCKILLKKVLLSYVKNFNKLPTQKNNERYIGSLMTLFERNEHKMMLDAMMGSLKAIRERAPEESHRKWDKISTKISRLHQNLDRLDSNLVFMFVYGNMLKALKEGDWILVDYINLAGSEMLQKLVPLINGQSILLYERGDLKIVNRHPDFRIFGCMNPGNDHGKKALPANLMDKFTVLVLPDPYRIDVELLIRTKCPALDANRIADLYFEARKRKTVSLRNLSRALNYINKNRYFYGQKAIYDGLLLGLADRDLVEPWNCKMQSELDRPGYALIHGFWVKKGDQPTEPFPHEFKLTSKFEYHLTDLLRAVAGTDLPVLLEGPTSAGKTTMIRYVASLSNHKCVRVNNHEHTDVEEYLGSYYPNKEGKLLFREGVLVEAVRNGYWLILDELNLARSEILECLNRLLDDNRYLFLPESQKHLKPHYNFRIFATQNPSSYSGRKNLSKAFRNRFVQLMMNEIGPEDTVDILAKRVPLVEHSKYIRDYMLRIINELGRYRLRYKIFIKDAMVTIRDLLKWTSRQLDQLKLKYSVAVEGYCILAERLRTEEEKTFIRETLFQNMKFQFDYLSYYRQYAYDHLGRELSYFNIQLNASFIRMAALVAKAHHNSEPTLLVGETGCGKTTLAELLAKRYGKKFYSINCHKHIYAADFVGCLRPVAKREENDDRAPFEFVDGVLLKAMQYGAILLIDYINTAEDSVLERMNEVFEGGGIGVYRGNGWETITARPGFYIVATMNPSGDFGKKYLSPALRNRFTEIWVEPVTHPKYLELYRSNQVKNDLVEMIRYRLYRMHLYAPALPYCLFNFVCRFNLELTKQYGLEKKMITMRDIVWILDFVKKSNKLEENIMLRYGWALWILTIEGSEFYTIQQSDREHLKTSLRILIMEQTGLLTFEPLSILSYLDFPLLIMSDLPAKLIPMPFNHLIFFNPHTELSDLLGQYCPKGDGFQWQDGDLLKSVREGGRVALVDLNMAQQQVVEGINSLFDYRGNIYVIDLGETVEKKQNWKPVVLIRTKIEGDRKMLPNSFLNRFVKLAIQKLSEAQTLHYLREKYGLYGNLYRQLADFLKLSAYWKIDIGFHQHELFLELYTSGCSLVNCLRTAYLQPFKNQETMKLLIKTVFGNVYPCLSSAYCLFIRELPLIRNTFSMTGFPYLQLLFDMFSVCRSTNFSICLKGYKTAEAKWQLVQALATVLHLQPEHILIGNSTDTAELLGSFEQITGYGKPIFKYIDSRLVQLLNRYDCLVYVYVFADYMVYRIEKGIRDVYNRHKRVIIGCSGIKVETEMAVFWYPDNPKKKALQHYFVYIIDKNAVPYVSRPNLTRFQQLSRFLNSDNIVDWFDRFKKKIEIELENQRRQSVELITKKNKKTTEKQQLDLFYLYNSLLLLKYEVEKYHDLDENAAQHIKAKDYLQETKWLYESRTRVLSTLALNPCYNPIYPTTLTRLTETMAKTESYHLTQYLLKCFVSTTINQLTSYLRAFDHVEHERIYKIRTKFIRLFLYNRKEFRKYAIGLLKLVKSEHVGELETEIDRIDSELPSAYVVLVREDLDDRIVEKSVPILNDTISAYELVVANLTTEEFPYVDLFRIVRRQEYLLPRVSLLLTGFERDLADSVYRLSQALDYSNIGQSIHNITIKQYFVCYRLFIPDFNKITEEEPVINIKSCALWIASELKLDVASLTDDQIGQYFWNIFRPNTDINQNIVFYAKQDIEHRVLSDYVHKKYIHYDLVGEVSWHRCGQFMSSRLFCMKSSLLADKLKVEELRKKLVYRGPDNIQAIKLFYMYLLGEIDILEQNGFSRIGITRFVGNLYEPFYGKFRDILLPLLTAVLLMLKKQDISYPCLLDPTIPNKSLKSLVDAFTVADYISKFEEDNAKRHLKFQKKLHDMIIDEYTEKGVQHHRQQYEEEIKETFGGGDMTVLSNDEPIDLIYRLLRPGKFEGYRFAMDHLQKCRGVSQLAICLQLLDKKSTEINIYTEPDVKIAMELATATAPVLQSLNRIPHTSEATRNITLMLNTLLEQKIYKTEIYKLLSSCYHIIYKIYELNQTLPKSMHVDCQQLISKAIELRRLEVRNWYKMLKIKDSKCEKNSLVELVHLCRDLSDHTVDRVFELCYKFMRYANISTYNLRLDGLKEIKNTLSVMEQKQLERVYGYYSYFADEHKLVSDGIRKEAIYKIKVHRKLAGWNSNEFLIFRSTCYKYHRQVHKILKKYEDDMTHTGILTVIENKRNKAFANSIGQFSTIHQLPAEQIQNDYEDMVTEIFAAMAYLKEPSHTNQSRLNVLRSFLRNLEEMFPTKSYTVLHHLPNFNYFHEPMKASNYYYSMWDKLCQRSQASWERETVERMWKLVESVWQEVNLKFSYMLPEMMEYVNYCWIERVLSEWSWKVKDHGSAWKQNTHPLFQKYIESLNQKVQKNPEIVALPSINSINKKDLDNLYSLLKMGHIIATITVNLQKNGFCVKDEQENEEGEGELEKGMGMAYGEVAEGANNAGDEIYFYEQLQGLRGEKEAYNDMDYKDNSEDFQMSGDFEGEVGKKYQKYQYEGEYQEQNDLDEYMGYVSQNYDYKMDQGQNEYLSGDEEAYRRKEEDLQFNADRKANEYDYIQAKYPEKYKDKQRNLGYDDFEENNEEEGYEGYMKGGYQLDPYKMEEEGEEEGQEQQEREFSEYEYDGEGEDEKMDIEEKEPGDEENTPYELSQSYQMEKDQMYEEKSEAEKDENKYYGYQEQYERKKDKIKTNKKRRPPAYGTQGDEQNPLLNYYEQKDGGYGEQMEEGQYNDGEYHKKSSFSRQFLYSLVADAHQADKYYLKRDLNVLEYNINMAEEEEGGYDYGLKEDAQVRTNLATQSEKQKKYADDQMEVEEKQEPYEKYRRMKEQKYQQKQEKLPEPKKKQDKKSEKLPLYPQPTDQTLEELLEIAALPNRYHLLLQQESLINIEAEKEKIKMYYVAQILENYPLKLASEEKMYFPSDLLSTAHHHSLALYEELKAVLEPQQIASYQGDYRTGKKLNMKKIIGFIASNYRKDRIWLRRAEPTDRNYQILLAMDDTKSMEKVGHEALKGLMALSLALVKLNIKLAISRIRDRMAVLTPFDQVLSEDSCPKVMDSFNFKYEDVNSHNMAMARFMSDSVQYLKEYAGKYIGSDLHQICFILSDGRFNKDYVRPYLTEAQRCSQTYIFIIIDRAYDSDSIMSIKSAIRNKDGRFVFKRYMDDFPFDYYLIVKDVAELSRILSDVLRQYFYQR